MKKLLSILFSLSVLVVAFAMTPEARRSFQAFENKAESGDPEAMYRLSALLESGFDSIPADTLRSLSMLKRSASAGFPPAQNYLGFLYKNGNILPENPDSAIYWISRAAHAGDVKAASNLAFLLLEDDEEAEALPWLQRAADAGMPQAVTRLADLYAEGKALAPDTLRAVALYEQAIGEGFRDAELRLLNLMGPRWRLMSSASSLSEALKYWDMGAYTIAGELLRQVGPSEPETGRAYALLGLAYSRGLGVPYDHGKSLEYFARAAQLGDPSAQFILSETLEIFPDALQDVYIDSDEGKREHGFGTLDAQTLREKAAEAGIHTPADATSHLLTAP